MTELRDETVAEPFDPYRDWLGIAGGRRVAHYYRLFALPPFEADRQKIAQAADAAIERIRRIDPAGQREVHGQLLSELHSAKQCLLDPATRSRYDDALRQRAAAAQSAAQKQAAAPSSAAPTAATTPSATAPSAATSSGATSSAVPPPPAAPIIPSAAPLPTAIPVAQPAAAPPRAMDAEQGAASSFSELESLWEDDHAIPRRLSSRIEPSLWRTPLAILLGFLIAAAILGVGALLLATLRGPDGPPAAGDLPAANAADAADAVALDEDGDASDGVGPGIAAEAAAEPAGGESLPEAAAELDVADAPGSPTRPTVNGRAPAGDPAAAPHAAPSGVTPSDEAPNETAPGEGGPRLPASSWKFTRALNRARGALERRDVELARRQLALAGELASAAADRETIGRLTALSDAVARFLDAARSGLPKFTAADELEAGDEPVSVVSVGPETLVLRMGGAQREYTVAALPAPVALTVARAGADEDAPASKVFFGAFHAVDPQGDRAHARRLWEAAAAAGEPVQPLLAILDSNDLVIVREPVPDATARSAAAERVAREFDVTIRGARSADQRIYLVEQLLMAAAKAEEAADQYALAGEACARAALAGDARRAVAAVDELARWFEVDALALKTETLVKTRVAANDAESARHVALVALALADEARERDELARTLAMTAVAAARRSGDAELLKRATVRRRQLERGAGATKAKGKD
ncbi:MAG: hypothetical protein AB7O59_04085 [Pirellulales bacterium]